MSIDEAYKSREQGASVHRLTVVTVSCIPTYEDNL